MMQSLLLCRLVRTCPSKVFRLRFIQLFVMMQSLSPTCPDLPKLESFSLYCAYTTESCKEANHSSKDANHRSKDFCLKEVGGS